MAGNRESIAQKNAQAVAELFGKADAARYELPLKNGNKLPLELYAPTAREVMQIIADYHDPFLIAQAAIDLVTGGVDIPAEQVSREEYINLRRRCFDLCSFIPGNEAAETAKPKEEEGDKETVPLSRS